MNHVSLFSGIGGADLAATWAGIETIAHSEIDPYCCKVLAKNFPGTPNLGDICSITKESFYHATGRTTADIISGGFPCQPFSVAGKQQGKADDRYLWPQMLRVIRELKPSWVIGENVAGFISMGLDDALSDLEAAGYECRAFVLPACSVGAPHQRYRVFIVANADSQRKQQQERSKRKVGRRACDSSQDVVYTEGIRCRYGHDRTNEWPANREVNAPTDAGLCARKDVANTNAIRLQTFGGVPGRQAEEHTMPASPGRPDGCWWATEPSVGRVAHGVPARVDRIRALGNAIVPQVIYPIFRAIVEASKGAS